jgi:hypothetical protein
VARTGRRSAALDRHSADNDRTGRQAREAKADDELGDQAKPGEGVARGTVPGNTVQRDERGRHDNQDRRGGG